MPDAASTAHDLATALGRGGGAFDVDNHQDVFVHYSAIQATGFRSLEAGQRVQLRVVRGDRGPQAESVRPLPSAR
ncbi:cold-shock protein [Streptomyces sp. NPDC003832]